MPQQINKDLHKSQMVGTENQFVIVGSTITIIRKKGVLFV